MIELTEQQRSILERPNYGHLATISPDGSPHVAPVWIDFRDGMLWVNTADGRAKVKHVRRDPRVAISVRDREDPEESVTVAGRVLEVTTEGADEHIHELSMRYRGRPFDKPEGQTRLILKITPERVY